MRRPVLALKVLAPAAVLALAVATHPAPPRARAFTVDTTPPTSPVKLVFVHHSSGENWLGDNNGGLGVALRDNSYFVSDTNYGWGPDDLDSGGGPIGDHTDIGHWYTWFAGPHRDIYLAALLAESDQHSSFTRLNTDPGGPNRIVMFKSCFPNSNLSGSPLDPPTAGANPLRGQDSSSEAMTVANAKGIYNDLLATFADHQDTLFVAVTAPPLATGSTDAERAANARAFTTWLTREWLASYPYPNVAVFDFYTVLTSNGGGWNVNDLGWETGNHHRVRNGTVEHLTSQGGNTAAYPDGGSDDHPSAAGNRKATAEFVPLLNVAYNRWRTGHVAPTPTPTGPAAGRPVRRRLASVRPSPTPVVTAAPGCTGAEPPPVTDLTLRQMPEMAEPPARAPFRDPTFGRCLVRVTDRTCDLAPGDDSGGLKNEYSRVQSFNADESRILVRGTALTWYLYDAGTLRPIAQLPIELDPRWDATDPDVLTFVSGPRLMRLDVRGQEPTVLHDFTTDFPGQAISFVWTRYEGSPSLDGRWWGLKVDDQDFRTIALLVYDQVQDRIVARRDMKSVPGADAIDNVTISPLGNWVLVDFGDHACEAGLLGSDAAPCGYMAYDRDLAHGRGLLRIAGHLDLALDAAGREVAVYQDIDTDTISMLDLATGMVKSLLPLDFSQHGFGLHVSGRGFDRRGWAVISTHDGDATSTTWMDKQVFLVELVPGGRVVRLAHHHSLVDPNQEHDYWAEPQATTNRDLTMILFTTNWGRSGTDHVDMVEIRLPPDWPAELP